MANETEHIAISRAALQQADGYSDVEPDGELVEELADTVTIEQLLDDYIHEVSEMFTDALDVSLEGNAVKTHIELQNFGQDIIELAYTLRRDLLANANRTDQFSEREVISPVANLSVGNQLRKQIVDEQAEGLPEQEN